MATQRASTPQRTAVMQRYQAMKTAGRASDTPMNPAQVAGFNPMNNQGGISNLRPGDVSFGTGSQSGQGSAYNMYPTGSYNTQFARNWDGLETNNQATNDGSNQIIGQFAQVERAMEPNISAYKDTAARLNTENQAALTTAKDNYVIGNTKMQNQSDNYYTGLNQYLQSQQGNQEAFAANEARRSAGSEQAANAAGQRVGQTYVGQSLDAQSKKYAEDKSIFGELTNYIKDYNANIKAGKDQYDLATQDKLLALRSQLANSLATQQLSLIGNNTGFNLNEIAAQRAFVRQQAAAVQANSLAESGATATTTKAAPSANTVAQQLSSLVATSNRVPTPTAVTRVATPVARTPQAAAAVARFKSSKK